MIVGKQEKGKSAFDLLFSLSNFSRVRVHVNTYITYVHTEDIPFLSAVSTVAERKNGNAKEKRGEERKENERTRLFVRVNTARSLLFYFLSSFPARTVHGYVSDSRTIQLTFI